MDFIEQLPLSSRFTAILIIINHLSKQGIFIPTVNTIDSEELALLFTMHIYSKHSVPNHTTPNHRTEFVSCFSCTLGEVLNMCLHFMLGYHPQGDGQTEQTTQTLKQYLHMYCSYRQSDWSTLLPLAEFTYNNTLSTTTGMTPLFTNKGYHPNIMVHAKCELTSTCTQEFMLDLDMLHCQLQENIVATQEYQYRYTNAQCMALPDFPLGLEAYVCMEFFHVTRLLKKLSDKMPGPFKVIA